LRSAIILQNRHWKEKYKNLLKRETLETLISFIDLKQIVILTGIRRSGKSSIFKLLINHLIEQNIKAKSILYINLDDPFFSDIIKDAKNLYKLLEESKVITGLDVKYLFLDEVQNVPHWEKFVKSIYDNEVVNKIFITGSNSKLLDGEYATLLSGRYINKTIYPLSFKEVLYLNKINSYYELLDKKSEVLKIIDTLLEYGSFYEVLMNTKKRELILSYYETIIFKDCIGNNSIKNGKSFKEIAHFIISNTSNLYSYNSLAKAVGSNEHTIKAYISYLEDSYLLKEIKNFNYSLKKQLHSKKKTYIVDNSFLAQISFRFSKDYGKLFENLVFNELLKQNYEIYFFNDKKECDFIVKKENKTVAIQVCYKLDNFNKDRELNGLNLPFDVDEKIVITYNQNDTIDDIKISNHLKLISYFLPKPFNNS